MFKYNIFTFKFYQNHGFDFYDKSKNFNISINDAIIKLYNTYFIFNFGNP